jgi:hypothetical protein
LVLCDALGLGCAEAGKAVEEGGADVEIGGLTLEGAGHEALAQELEASHLGLNATSTVASAPGAPD